MERREFLKLLGVGLGAAIVDPMKAAAQRGRILRDDRTMAFPYAPGHSPEFRGAGRGRARPSQAGT